MKRLLSLLVLSLLCLPAQAGWNDLNYSSSENLMDARQGRNVSLTLSVSNEGITDGYAVYITNVTLVPDACINGGRNISSVGLILCPKSDLSCRVRFYNAGTRALFNFSDITTSAGCGNGLKNYSFEITGNYELLGAESRWSGTPRESRTINYSLRFTGPDVCGDRFCALEGESCVTCPEDCGRCSECAGSSRACVNGSVYSCLNGFYSVLSEACQHGCNETPSGPECARICAEGESRCAGGSTEEACFRNTWVTRECLRGCVDGSCREDLCYGVSCPDACTGGRARSFGYCDPANGNCSYFSVENCSNGCAGSVCAPATPTPPAGGPTPSGQSLPCLGPLFFLGAFIMSAARAGGAK